MRLAVIAALIAAPAFGQEATLPEPRDYFCSLNQVVVVEDGRENHFEDAYDDKKRPSLTKIPKTGEDGMVAESVSEDGSVYAYVKRHREGLEQYMIHGTFQFAEQKLITTRSVLFPSNDGTWVTEATAFTFLCEPAQQPQDADDQDG